MRVSKIISFLRMVFDPGVIRALCDMHGSFKTDRSYSFINLIKGLWEIVKSSRILKFENAYIISSVIPPIPSRAFTQMINATPGKSGRFYELTHSIRTAPVSMHIAVTSRCKYQCTNCSAALMPTAVDTDINTLKRLASDIQKMGVAIIGLTGGEPLMRSDIEDVISCIDSRSATIIYTSGYSLSSNRARRLKEVGLFGMAISLDHYQPLENDNRRGFAGAYDIASGAVRESKAAGLYTILQTTIAPASSDDFLWKMVLYAQMLGAHEVRFIDEKYRESKACVSLSSVKDDHDRYSKIQHKALLSFNLPKVTFVSLIESQSQFGCCAANLHAYIDSAGNLHPCDFVPLVFGNIHETPIAQLWQKMSEHSLECNGLCTHVKPQLQVRQNEKKNPVKQLPEVFGALAGAR